MTMLQTARLPTPHPFEARVQSLVRCLGDGWATFSKPAGATAQPNELLQARIQQLQPRTLEEGMAAKELGWAWADGAGYAEWDAQFLLNLTREGLLGQFLAFLMHLRSSATGVGFDADAPSLAALQSESEDSLA